jgi:hypothetical protein
MSDSIFTNFDPEKDSEDYLVSPQIANAGVVPLLKRCISWCSRWDREHMSGGWLLLTNEEFRTLERRVNDLAELGFERRAEIEWIPPNSPDSIEFDDRPPSDWAAHVIQDDYISSDVIREQMYGLCALKTIDVALTYVIKDGWCADTVNLVMYAITLENKANHFRLWRAHELFKSLKENRESRIEDGINLRQSENARDAAVIRHAKVRALKEEALRLYTEKTWISRLQAAKAIFPQIQAFGKEKYNFQLSADRGAQTIYEWFGKHDNKTKT